MNNWLEGQICPGCGNVLTWQWVDPPREGWWECGAGEQWQIDRTGRLMPRAQVPTTAPTSDRRH
ncbi:hypothetical protein GCM10023321_72530 [Pseudonocardia eucalypti]|uniref:Uncharacterized protein n=1 Tax=Pseudonocardia eucalypti TaxID=648755 RepID=A0ABP9R7D8_9PSEU